MLACSHACFKCEQCGAEELVQNVVGHIDEPKRCGNDACRATWSLKMVHNRSLFLNKQIVKMQARADPACPACPPGSNLQSDSLEPCAAEACSRTAPE